MGKVVLAVPASGQASGTDSQPVPRLFDLLPVGVWRPCILARAGPPFNFLLEIKCCAVREGGCAQSSHQERTQEPGRVERVVWGRATGQDSFEGLPGSQQVWAVGLQDSGSGF